MRSLLTVADPTERLCAFSSPKAPAPAPVPVAPSQSGPSEAERQFAAREALIAEAEGGQRKNIVAGREEAYKEQSGRALMRGAKARGASATSLLG